jgi:PAS domain-containing protein
MPTQIVSVNPAFTEMTGYPVEEALGRNPRFLGRQDAHPPGITPPPCSLRSDSWQAMF